MSRDFLCLERRTAVAYAVLILLAFGAYSVAWPEAPLPGVDTPRYLDAARDLSDLRIDQLQFRTPGYPLLLVLTGSADNPGRRLFYVALALHLAAVWLVGTVMQALQFRRPAILGTAIVLLAPPLVENAAYVLSETLTQFMLVSGFAAAIHWFRSQRAWLLILSGFAFAYAALTRPTYQVVAFAIAVVTMGCWWIANDRRRNVTSAMAALLVPTILAVGGYSAINYIRFGYPGVTPMLGFHLGTKTLRVLERIPERDRVVKDVLLAHRDAHLVSPNSSHTGYMYVWSAMPDLEKATGMNTAELSRHMLRVNLRLIAAAPLEYVMEVLRASCSYWLPSVTSLGSMHNRGLQLVWSMMHFGLLAVFVLQGVLALGASMLLAARWRIRRRVPLLEAIGCTGPELLAYTLAGTLVLYTMLVSVLVESGVSRVRTPADVFVVVMIPIGVRFWLRQVRREETIAAASAAGRGATISLVSRQKEQCIG